MTQIGGTLEQGSEEMERHKGIWEGEGREREDKKSDPDFLFLSLLFQF